METKYIIIKISNPKREPKKEEELTGELSLSDDYVNYAVIPIENKLFTTEDVLKEFHKKGYQNDR